LAFICQISNKTKPVHIDYSICVELHVAILIKGGSALDAVEVATQSMEDSEVLNAGRGSYLTEEGTVELDAMIMNGQTLNTGKLIVLFF